MKPAVQAELVARFAEHLENGTTDCVNNSLQVPAPHYTDPAQALREQDKLFRQAPLLVALSPDLPAPGSYLTHQALDTNLLLVRDSERRVRTYINACRHRGARLIEGRGAVKSFSCPFHAWHWSIDGNLLARPNSNDGFDDTGSLCDQLIECQSLEINGMIFVLLEGENIEAKVNARLGDALAEIGNYHIEDTVFFESREAVRGCNYKLIIDGFCEAYHISALHKETISPYYYTTPSLTDLTGDTVRMIGVRRSIDSEMEKPPAQRELLSHATTQYLIAPNIVLVHQVDHIQFWRVYPAQDADHCRIEFSLYWPQPLDEEAERKARFNVDILWDVITGEDIPQALSIQNNLKSGAVDHLYFGRNEPALIHYHQAIAKHIGSDQLQAVDKITKA